MARCSDLAVALELAWQHLAHTGPAPSGEPRWASRLIPMIPFKPDYHADVDQEQLNRVVSIRKQKLSASAADCVAVRIHQRIMAYMELKRYLDSNVQVDARVLICEILKEWALAHYQICDSKADVKIVSCYRNFVSNLLYYHDRWAASEYGIRGAPRGIIRSQQQETFVTLLANVHDDFQKLERQTRVDAHHMDQVKEVTRYFQQFIDQAACVAFLGATTCHQEFAAFAQDLSVDRLADLRREVRGDNSEVFWGSDFGRVLGLALVHGDPERFSPLGEWIVWTEAGSGNIRAKRFYQEQPAEAYFQSSVYCAILLTPDMHRRSNTTNPRALKRLGLVIDGYLGTQSCAEAHSSSATSQDSNSDSNPYGKSDKSDSPPIMSVSSISKLVRTPSLPRDDSSDGSWRGMGESFRPQLSESFRPQLSDNIRPQTSENFQVQMHQDCQSQTHDRQADFDLLIKDVRVKWLLECNLERSGIAEPFLREGSHQPDVVANALFSLATGLAALLDANRTIMEPLRGISTSTGSLGMLTLRQWFQEGFSQLVERIDRFTDSAISVNEIFEAHFFKALREGKHGANIEGQLPELQRVYRQRFIKTCGLRQEITQRLQSLAAEMPPDSWREEKKMVNLFARSCTLLKSSLGGAGPRMLKLPQSENQFLALPPSQPPSF